jgi:hypothetical protein
MKTDYNTITRFIRLLTRWAWRTELDELANIDAAQKNPPKGKIRMYCAGWRDKNMIGLGDYYLHSVHATPEMAKAEIEYLREKNKWSENRSISCGQCVDVFFPTKKSVPDKSLEKTTP